MRAMKAEGSGFVADSSVGVAWGSDSQSDTGTQQLKAAAISGTSVVVPVLWALEVANSFLMLLRRKRITRSEWSQACQGIAQIRVVLDDEAPVLAFTRVSELAEQYTLTTYDATYLELAIRLGIPLATRDTALSKAARKCGVKTLL